MRKLLAVRVYLRVPDVPNSDVPNESHVPIVSFIDH